MLWGVTTLVFVILRLLPGDPASIMLQSVASPELLATLKHQLGLDLPLPLQYLHFLANAATGDLGVSIYTGAPAADELMQRLPATLQLVSLATLLALVIAFPIGIAASLRPWSVVDQCVGMFTLVAEALPSFWIGPMLILIFARQLHILPSSGNGEVRQLILPTITLALPILATIARLVRSGMLDVFPRDFVRTARAKGLSDQHVLNVHVLRNMLLPVVTYLGLQIGQLLVGAVVVEIVFAWPGVGRLLVDSISQRDYPVIQACVLVIAAVFVGLNLLVDSLYAVIDPRIRHA